MIKLKKEVNKSAIMRELRKEADKMYANSWESEYAKEKFMEGAERLFNLLCLPVFIKSVCPKCGSDRWIKEGEYCECTECMTLFKQTVC